MASPRPAPAVSSTAKVEQRVIYNDLSNIDQFSEDIKELLHQSRGSNRSQDSLYPTGLKLLARMFGDECTGLEFQATTAGWVQDGRGLYNGGGWLKKLCTRNALLSPSRMSDSVRTQSHGMQSLPPGVAKLIQHFLPRSQYLDVMTSNGRLDVKIRLDRFPVKGQICIRQSSYYECVSSPNQIVYFPPYFKTASSEQYQPLLRSDTDPCLMLKFHEFFFICMLRYPKDYKGVFDGSNGNGARLSDGSGLNTSSSDSRGSGKAGTIFGKLHDVLRNSAVGHVNTFGLFGLIDGNPYMALLFESLKDFIPHDGGNSGSNSSITGTSSSSSASKASANTPGRGANQVPSDLNLSAAGELFIRLVAEYWMDSATLVRRNHAQGANFKAQLNKTMVHYNNTDPSSKHPGATDIMTLDSNSMSWSAASMQCTYVVLVRMLSDPMLSDHFVTLAQINGDAFESAHLMASYARASGYTRASSQGAHQASIVCPPALSLVQQPLFDMLRTVFNKSDTASGSEWEMHAMAVECWLLWIQPWKAVHIAQGYALDKVDSLAAYSREKWLPYIAANLHFYTTILATFLRLASKTDLSVVEEPGIVHLLLLEKVMLAFAPLMDDIQLLVGDFKLWYSDHSRDLANKSYTGNLAHPQTPASHSFSSRHMYDTPLPLMVSMRAQHHWLFPDSGIDKLPDFGLLEVRDFCKQHARKIISSLTVAMRDCTPKKQFSAVELAAETVDMLFAVDHWGGGMFSMSKLLRVLGFSTVVSSDASMLARVKADIEKVEAVTACPSIVSGETTAATKENSSSKDNGRINDTDVTDESTGILKSYGRYLLQSGKKVPIDQLRWFEDVLDMPQCSYEIHFLVRWLVTVSTMLNEKYQLPHIKEASRWTWKRLSLHLHEYTESGKLPVRAKYDELGRLMRFNFRPLADVRVVSAILLFFGRYSFMFRLLGNWNYALLAHAACLFYYNTTNLYPIYYTTLFALITVGMMYQVYRLF